MRATLRRCACGGSHSGPECEDCRKRRLSRHASPTSARVPSVPPAVHAVLGSPGRPLEPGVRWLMESRLGYDFNRVRIHDDRRAAESATVLEADAYTVGSHVVFRAGRYAPDTAAGRHLLAHELAHVVQQRGDAEGGPLAVVPPDHPSEREAEAIASGSAERPLEGAGGARSLQRYAHQDCSEDDLRNYVWPADWHAREMTRKAIDAVTASPIASRTADLFEKYFMTRTPDTATIAREFRTVKAAFDDSSYTYECEDDCGGTKLGYSGLAWDIHLCINHLSSASTACVGRTIVHEFTHKYGWLDDEAYCKSGCGFSRCPASLDTDDALDNADSYACFAYELHTGP